MGNRNIFDIMGDLQMLQAVCNEWNEYRKMVQACINKFGIERFEPCTCSNKSDLERIQCKKCGGVGYIITLRNKSSKSNTKSNENKE